MGKVGGIQTGKPLTVVYRFSYHQQRSQGQVIVTNDTGQVLQYPPVDFLFLLRQLVAGSHRRLRRIGLQEFFLHLLHDGRTQVDAHGTL